MTVALLGTSPHSEAVLVFAAYGARGLAVKIRQSTVAQRRPESKNCVEKLCLIAVPVADSLLFGAGDSADDGRAARDAGGAVLRLQPRAARPGQSPASQDRPFCGPSGGPEASGALLQRDGSSFDQSRADDAYADRRLRLRHSPRASIVRGGPPQSGLSMVLSIGARWRRPRSFDLLQEPPRPVS